MTLTKRKPRTSASYQKRTAKHHRQSSHYLKPYWPYLPIVAIVSLGFVFNSWLGTVHKDVLGYATDMSVSSLLNGTNNQRTANGLGALALNSQLDQAAQAKAQDMMNNDYWAHTSPSGVTPWYWITNAGYSYQTAGENLAYGFATSSDTITGWMNSPGHRANILNTTYREVGFGIVNAPNYQSGGPETIVVAMYADPYAAPAPAPAPVVAQPTTNTLKSTLSSSGGGQAAAQPSNASPVATPVQGPTPSDTDTATPANTTSKTSTSKKPETSVPQKEVSRVQVITAANVAWTQFAVSMTGSIALLIFLLRHSFAWHKFLVRGEGFVLHHPLLDILFVVIATLGFILTQTTGIIK